MLGNMRCLLYILFAFVLPLVAEDKMVNQPKTAIIFDFGGVVILSDGADSMQFIRESLDSPLSKEEIKKQFWLQVKDLNIGKVDESYFWNQFASSISGKLPENWNELWQRHYLTHDHLPNHQIIDLVKKLRAAGYATPLLSDTIPSHAACNQELYALFDPVVLSFNIGFKKPDPRSYRFLLDLIHRQPEECIFIDDLAVNVNGASAVGIHGVHFTSFEELARQLAELGVEY
jgi:epoxide hydrolase-like predicted phosphatase